MRSGPSAMLAGAALALAGGAIGFLVGLWSASPAASDRPPTEIRVEPRGITPALTDLRRADEEILRALRELERPQPAGSNREPALADDRLDRLISAVEKMSERFEAEVRGAGKGRGHGTLELFQDSIRYRIQMIGSGFGTSESLLSDLRAAHALWTQADLIGRYGSPISVGDENGGKVLTYEAGDGPGSWVQFFLADDKVTDFRLIRDFVQPR